MLTNYNTLWKLYVFADMRVVRENADNIPAVYAQLVKEIGVEYPVSGLWRDVETVNGLLKPRDLHDAVDSQAQQAKGQRLAPPGLLEFVTHPTVTGQAESTWRRKLGGLRIRAEDYEEAWKTLRPRFESAYPNWDWSRTTFSQNDRDSLMRWLSDQLSEIADEIHGESREA
jgi:hypothetical protein